jgi:hypothetical protein
LDKQAIAMTLNTFPAKAAVVDITAFDAVRIGLGRAPHASTKREIYESQLAAGTSYSHPKL